MSASVMYYEIAATGFFVLLFLVELIKRHLPSKRAITFQVLLCVMMLAAFLKVNNSIILYYGGGKHDNVYIYAVTLLFEVLCFYSYYIYIQAFTCRLWRTKLHCAIDITVFAITAIVILSSIWTGLCFDANESGKFQLEPFFNIIVGVIVIAMLYSIWTIWQTRKEYTFQRLLLCILLTAGFMVSAIYEILKPESVGVFGVYIVFFMYGFCFSLQSPDFYVDNATKALNRNGFIEVFRERIAYKEKTSCLIIRVRNFNTLNQIYGAGLLCKVQIQIKDILEKNAQKGVVYHIGASTFAVIFRSKKEVLQMYEKLYEEIPTAWEIEDEVVNHEYSFYHVSYPENGEDAEELIQRIHYARSDHESRHKAGTLVELRHDTVAESELKKKVAHLIEEAIMDNSIELNFHPIFSIEKNRITSLEVLSRLKDENKQYINPEFFIRVAEENHTIIPLGEQIFRKACQFASRNKIFEMGIEDININLSPAQCRFEGLTESFISIAKEYNIPMEKIHLEITESEFKDQEAVERTLKRMKKSGAMVAMDDFGTGSSMLSNILELPVDFVKIDKSLVWSFAEGKNQFLNDLMPLIRAEGKKIIAEGIETEEHATIIKNLQGDFLQGYYFTRPLPEEQFIMYLKKINDSKNQ